MVELPNLLNRLSHPQESQEKKEYFWALEIWDGGVKSAIWTVEEGKTKVVALGSREAWSEGAEDLVAGVDKSFSTAAERFIGTGEEPSKVILGLPNDWIKENKIIPERKEMVRLLCQKLELQAVGFVLTFDALNHHLKEIEGIPASAILIHVSKLKVAVGLIEHGTIRDVKEVARSENLALDVTEGLSRFADLETLPSRMILFNGEDMESLRQILIAHPWQAKEQNLPFLHFPKVEILPQDLDITAISLAGGREVAKAQGIKLEEEKEISQPELVEVDLGFVAGKDILEEKVEEVAPPEAPPEPALVEEREEEKEEKRKLALPPLPEIPAFNFSALKEKLSQFSPSALPGMPTLAILGGIVVFILGAVLVGFIWYFPKAEVTIFVEPQVLEKDIEFILDPNQEILDEKNMILPARILEIEESGEKTIETTGQKTVGEKAKGEVVIYNRTDSPKSFSEGAVISGPGGLKFTLDREASVASKTPDLISGVDKWGEAKVGITAADIGAQYNLAANSQFSFKDFPTTSYLAKNESALTGGTSRQIQAVSEEDQENLLSALTDELQEKARLETEKKVLEGRKVVKESLSSNVITKDFNHEAGDETETLKLSLKIKASALTFSEGEFFLFSEKLLSESIPPDFILKKEQLDASFETKKTNEDGSIVFKTHLKANLLPKLDLEEITKKIKGKSLAGAQEYLSSLPGYVESEFLISPRLPGILLRLPRIERKITIEIRGR